MKQDWEKVDFEGKFEFSLPAGLSEVREQGIDSSVARWEGEGITVRIDYGVFSDPLTSYGGRPNFRLSDAEIGDRAARIVSFDQSDGKHLVAAHFHGFAKERRTARDKLTIVVETEPSVKREVASRIIRSVRFQGATK